MKFWQPDPIGRRTGKSDVTRFLEWYTDPFVDKNLATWSAELAIQRAGRAAFTWFTLGYAEAYFSGATIGQRYMSGIRAVSTASQWKYIFPRISVPLAAVTGVQIANTILHKGYTAVAESKDDPVAEQNWWKSLTQMWTGGVGIGTYNPIS